MNNERTERQFAQWLLGPVVTFVAVTIAIVIWVFILAMIEG